MDGARSNNTPSVNVLCSGLFLHYLVGASAKYFYYVLLAAMGVLWGVPVENLWVPAFPSIFHILAACFSFWWSRFVIWVSGVDTGF